MRHGMFSLCWQATVLVVEHTISLWVESVVCASVCVWGLWCVCGVKEFPQTAASSTCCCFFRSTKIVCDDTRIVDNVGSTSVNATMKLIIAMFFGVGASANNAPHTTFFRVSSKVGPKFEHKYSKSVMSLYFTKSVLVCKGSDEIHTTEIWKKSRFCCRTLVT